MSNDLVLSEQQQKFLAERGIDHSTWHALTTSVFPGAQPESVLMAYEYCRARKLDPLKKPCHIVPMYVRDSRTGKGEMRDVIMPGIYEHRTTAARTGEYAGSGEPEFGDMVEHDIGGQKIRAPEWCRVTVYRLINGEARPFTHVEFFEEAVATKKDGTPNAMWSKRRRGQLAKCAEAGALRKAFPEELGGEPTAEEMAGRYDEPRDITPSPSAPSARESVATLSGEVEPAPAEPEQPPSAAVLFDSEGAEIGQYQKAGSYLNALDKAIEEAGDRETAQALWKANADTIERIAGLEKHEARVAELSENVAGKAAGTEQASEPQQEDVF